MSPAIEIFDDYIKVSLGGVALAADEIKKQITAVAALCNKHDKHCMIYRANYSPQVASTGSFYELGAYWASQSPGTRKHALVFPDQSLKEIIQFMETVALNRGVNVRSFTSLADAEQWLTSDSA